MKLPSILKIVLLFNIFFLIPNYSFSYNYDIKLAEDIIIKVTDENNKKNDDLEVKLAFKYVVGFIGYINNIRFIIEEGNKIYIAIFGNFSKSQEKIYKEFNNKTIGVQKIRLKILLNPNVEELKSVNIIYITQYYSDVNKILNNIEIYNKLTVVDREHFEVKEAMIKFYTYRDKLKFLINNKLALENGIMLNAKLLELGTPNL